jgi:DNA-binding response OmpR family regulator
MRKTKKYQIKDIMILLFNIEKVKSTNIVNKNILLVDDEPDITFTLNCILKVHNFTVDAFTDPTIALKFFKINFYDLVILDVKMPNMNGFQLYNKIREQDPKVKICFLTAGAIFPKESKKSILKLDKNINKDFFIQKPIQTVDLIKRITGIIKNDNEEIIYIN